MATHKPLLCLDFDGVIHSYSSGWKGATNIPDQPVEGALEFLLAALGKFEVAIFSSRSKHVFGRRAMKKWLRVQLRTWMEEKKIPWRDLPHYVQDYGAPPGYAEAPWPNMIVGMIKWPLFKPAASVTIDDRAITFTGEWPSMDKLAAFKPWNKLK